MSKRDVIGKAAALPWRVLRQGGRLGAYVLYVLPLAFCGMSVAEEHWALVPPRVGPVVLFDINADGIAEAIERELGNDSVDPRLGVVRVLDGATGTLLYEVIGDAPNDHFAAWAAPMDDVNGDGCADLAVCAPLVNRGGSREGRVIVFSGLNGERLAAMSGAADHRFGVYATSAGDRDADGRGDLWVASLSQISADTGLLWWTLCSGIDGRVLSERASVEILLDEVVPMRDGDVNGDGVVDEADLVVVIGHIGASGIAARLGDVNGDAVVDASDLGEIIRRFGDVGEEDHPAFTTLRGDLPSCDEVLSCGADCDLCDSEDWQDFVIRLPGPVPPIPPPPAPWCGASLRYPENMLWNSDDAISFYLLHADATVQWEILEGQGLLEYAIVQDAGQRLSIGTGTGTGVVEGRALYQRQNPHGSCAWNYYWSIEVDECHAFLEMLPQALAIPLGATAEFVASGLPGGGSFEWWIESIGREPGPVGIPIVEFVDPGDSPEFVLRAGRYPGTASIYVRYTSDSCQRVRVMDVAVIALPENDFDGDQLSDYHEVVIGTDALDGDTDDDGLRDGGEVACGFDPLNPLIPPPDHPGLAVDTDNDGIADLAESCGSLTDPGYFDTDGDGLGDGWELDQGLRPDTPDTDGDGVPDGYEDPDGDGLSNAEEARHGSDPNNGDTDGDGTGDGDEVDQGGFPNDPSDGGAPPPEDEVARILLTVGDHSESESERWRLVVGDVGLSSPAGEVVEQEFPIWRGRSARVELLHLGSTASPPDYDYTAFVTGVGDDASSIYIHDPDGLLGVDETGGENAAAGLEAHVYIPVVDLDIDTDNTNGLDAPDRSESEEDLETEPSGMKVMVVNRGDRDDDAIPDYADGFGAFGPDSAGGVQDVRFVPIVVDLRGLPPESIVRFEYPASPPQDVMRETVPIPEIQDEYFRYHRGAGTLRLWKRDGYEARTADDFVETGVDYALEDLEPTQTLYVEAVNGSHAPVTITVTVSSDILPVLSDSVQVLAFDSLTKLSVNEIAGFDIHYGSAVGGPGNDIIIGTDGNDVIQGGGGDDIIVAGRGDDIIDPGDGSNVIFASFGQNLIGPEEPPVADGSGARPPPTGLRGPEDDDVYLSENGGPITTEEVIRVYKAIYGENDPWLRIFLEEVGGTVECVESVGAIVGFFRNHDWDRRRDHVNGGFAYVAQLDLEIQSPFLAATRLREMLLHMAAAFNGPTHIFQGAMYGIAWEQALACDDYDETITAYQELRQRAFSNAVASSARLANIYVSGIGILSEASDVVVTVSELSEGNLTAAVGLFPVLPARIIDDAASGIIRIVLPTGETLDEFRKVGRVVWGAESGLGYIVRSEMTYEAKMVNGRLVKLIGRAQNPGGGNGPEHDDLVRLLARTRIDGGDVEYATINRSLRTATGLDDLGELGRRRPDAIVIRRDGRVDLIEVRSEGQEQEDVEDLLRRIRDALPAQHRGSIYAYNLDGTLFLQD